MDKFRRELEAFVRQVYEGERKVLVYGEWRAHARVMLVGEAPREQDALQGRPFVGRAGKNLDRFLEDAGIAREALYLTNAVKFRPTRLSAANRTVNRPPTQEEIRLFAPWLWREIELVDPLCVVTLGNVPLRAVSGRALNIGGEHGRFFTLRGRNFFPMYHPASLIYNPSLRPTYAEDLRALGEWLHARQI